MVDLTYSPAAETFRQEIRTWLASSVPTTWRTPGFWLEQDPDRSEDMRRGWEQQRCDAGFAGVDWPVEYGGQGGDAEIRAVHDEEMAAARAPVGPFHGLTYIGTALLGPSLLRFGTDEQKRKILPDMLAGRRVWVQGFSEPEAGSDLASLRTSARRDGDDFIVSGQKIWTSFAREGDSLFTLVRTEPSDRRQEGITFMLIDLKSAGVEVNPIKQMSGSSEFGEEFLDDVHVPIAGNVVGEIGRGWDVAKYLLSVERNSSPMSHYVEFRHELADLIAVARSRRRDGVPALSLPHIRRRVAACATDLELLRLRAYDAISTVQSGRDVGVQASVTKLHWSATRLAIADLGAAVLACDGQESSNSNGSDVSHLRWRHLHVRGQRIAGGTAQVQRTLVAQQLLGLPR